jgi:hypothetical protein
MAKIWATGNHALTPNLPYSQLVQCLTEEARLQVEVGILARVDQAEAAAMLTKQIASFHFAEPPRISSRNSSSTTIPTKIRSRECAKLQMSNRTKITVFLQIITTSSIT